MSKVIVYEINEVPWTIVDLYVKANPSSNLAKLLVDSRCETSRCDDPELLMPWRSWPTFHKGLYAFEHNSYDLGQDPDSFTGVNVWDVAEEQGLKVGLWAPLQSWPAKKFAHGGFHVPDTFARTPATEPPEYERFQRFNLSMTSELGFSPDVKLKPTQVVAAGLDLVRRGLTLRSAARIVQHLVKERVDARNKAGRSILQALPGFDLYWRLHRKVEPDLSIFFSNHVAGMMHRFWGDVVPGYAEKEGYEIDELFSTLVMRGMDVLDQHLGTLRRWIDKQGDTVLVLAASMGQDGVHYYHIGDTLVLDDPLKLAAALDLGPAERGLAMYPMNGLTLADDAAAIRAGKRLAQVKSTADDAPIFDRIRVEGRSVTFDVQTGYDWVTLADELTYPTVGDEVRTGPVAELGIIRSQRMGGGNTGYHVPDGIYITYGPGIAPDPSRAVFDVREAPRRLLAHLGVEDAWKVELSTSTPARP